VEIEDAVWHARALVESEVVRTEIAVNEHVLEPVPRDIESAPVFCNGARGFSRTSFEVRVDALLQAIVAMGPRGRRNAKRVHFEPCPRAMKLRESLAHPHRDAEAKRGVSHLRSCVKRPVAPRDIRHHDAPAPSPRPAARDLKMHGFIAWLAWQVSHIWYHFNRVGPPPERE